MFKMKTVLLRSIKKWNSYHFENNGMYVLYLEWTASGLADFKFIKNVILIDILRTSNNYLKQIMSNFLKISDKCLN